MFTRMSAQLERAQAFFTRISSFSTRSISTRNSAPTSLMNSTFSEPHYSASIIEIEPSPKPLQSDKSEFSSHCQIPEQHDITSVDRPTFVDRDAVYVERNYLEHLALSPFDSETSIESDISSPYQTPEQYEIAPINLSTFVDYDALYVERNCLERLALSTSDSEISTPSLVTSTATSLSDCAASPTPPFKSQALEISSTTHAIGPSTIEITSKKFLSLSPDNLNPVLIKQLRNALFPAYEGEDDPRVDLHRYNAVKLPQFHADSLRRYIIQQRMRRGRDSSSIYSDSSSF